MLKITTGCSIKTFLCEQMELDTEYIMDTITTVLLDGRPVDDIDAALLRDGSVLALSAAMPGLIGAAIRRGGLCASLRSSITYKEGYDQFEIREGMVTLKLFNILLKELSSDILKRGIYVYASSLRDFLRDQAPEMWSHISNIFLNGKPVDMQLLQTDNCLHNDDIVFLTVSSQDL